MSAQIQLSGKVTRVGYYRDTLPLLVIIIKKEEAASLPAQAGARQPIQLSIHGETYLAGIRTTSRSANLTISPDLLDENDNPIRLSDLLLRNNILPGADVCLFADGEGGLTL